MSSFTCRPDRYMSKTDLDELFEEFNVSMNAGQSTAAIFSSLVNSVRQAYISPVMETREEMLCQHKDHARELAALRREQKEERGSLPQDLLRISETAATAGHPATIAPSETTPDAPVETLHPVGMIPEKEISWPGYTFPLLIGSTDLYYRRDMTDWENMSLYGWMLRLQLKVFRFQEPGTIKVFVAESTDNEKRHRIIVSLHKWHGPIWQPRMEFYAYGQPRPGTDLIWVGKQDNPERCIFVKGDKNDVMTDWEHMFDFWVPK